MNTGDEGYVRFLALQKGFDLIRSHELAAVNGGALYQVMLPGHDVAIFPAGRGVYGASLNEVKDWLAQPWE